ncbi:MAG: hypothetical protein M3Q42_05240 [Pseudomonadota bacterium]|nr:hypothetical protein [Pseudomonadota bacterium]
MRRGARTDDNHAAILAVFRRLGALVCDTSHVGGGFPDALVSWRGRILPVEIKDGAKPPSARKLTAAQCMFHAEWERAGTPVHVVKTEAEALALLGARAAA